VPSLTDGRRRWTIFLTVLIDIRPPVRLLWSAGVIPYEAGWSSSDTNRKGGSSFRECHQYFDSLSDSLTC
jgi:hypothetical protein